MKRHHEIFPGFIRKLSGWVAPGKKADILFSILYGIFRLFRIRRKVALQNMDIVFPEKTVRWKKELLRQHYRHLSLSLVEYLVLLKATKKSTEYMHPVSPDPVLGDLTNQGKGCVIFTAHTGNWEMLAAWLGAQGFPMHAIVRRHENKAMEDFVEEARQSVGLRTIAKDESMLKVVRLLKKGGFVGILGDQFAGAEGEPMLFFGKKTSCYTGAAALALLAGVPLVPVVSWRKAPFSHEVTILPPAYGGKEDVKLLTSEEKKARILKISSELNTTLERWIVSHPEQWLWLHRRFR